MMRMRSNEIEVEQEFSTDKIRLGNLYIYHVLAFIHKTLVVDCDKNLREPDERIMRHIEEECNITEQNCVEHRQKVADQVLERRMDYVYNIMGETLTLISHLESIRTRLWFEEWPTALPVVETHFGEKVDEPEHVVPN